MRPPKTTANCGKQATIPSAIPPDCKTQTTRQVCALLLHRADNKAHHYQERKSTVVRVIIKQESSIGRAHLYDISLYNFLSLRSYLLLGPHR
jgi:hypothetical protein